MTTFAGKTIPPIFTGPTTAPVDFLVSPFQLWKDGNAAITLTPPAFSVGDLLAVFITGVGLSDLVPVNAADWTLALTATGFPQRVWVRIATGTSNDDFDRDVQPSGAWGGSQFGRLQVTGTGIGSQVNGVTFGGGLNTQAFYPEMGVSGAGESVVFSSTIRFTVSSGLDFGPATAPITMIDFVANDFDVGAYLIWGYDHQETTPAFIAQGDYDQQPLQSENLFGRSSRIFITP